MDEIGSILREAREARGFTIEEAQAATRISGRFLRALEEGAYERLPTPVHVRGFLKNYARYLSLDPEPLLERYDASRNNQPVPVPTGRVEDITPDKPLPGRVDQPFFNPVNVDLNASTGGGGTESTLRVFIIVALIVAVILAATRFVPLLMGRGDGQEVMTNAIQSLLEDEVEPGTTPAGSDAATSAGESLDPNITPQPIVPTGRNNAGAAISTPALPTPTRPSLPAVMETVRLRMDITERTWLRVTVDGEVVLEGQVKLGDGPYEWEALEEATLLTGNGAGVFVTINGIELGRLAGRGEVWEETWRASGSN
jgi:cytoskeletal protein RodZ